MDRVEILKLTATGLAGLFAGGAIYINLCEAPARATLDVAPRNKQWGESFKRAKRWQGGLVFASSAPALAVYCLDGSDNRKLWAVGAGVFLLAWPWTLIVMISDIKKGLEDDVIDKRGEEWVKNNIAVWNKRHMFRSIVSMTAIGIFLYALQK
ncbi:hypothetical protein ScPMuIL_015606 [Solemya velum]